VLSSTTKMHHSTDDDSELEVRPVPVQQRDDSASSSDSRPLHDPDSASAVSSHTISITVSHGSSDHHLHVPDHATFGDLKKAFVLETVLEASDMNILFWGDEKDDAEQLQAAGVTDGSNVVLVEEPNNGVDHVEPPPVMTEEIAKAISAVLAVSGEEFDMAAELLMRQLLKLDGIKADGEARVQRKAEVRRIQKLQEDVDTLKARCYRAKPQL
ncbi:hypothetical protein HID58_077627, partial [Brassica napus]